MSPNLDIETILINGQSRAVDQRLAAEKPFCTLTEYSLDHSSDLPRIVLAAPLSGHYSVLLRDMVIGLLPRFRVYITNWISAGEVPASKGPFGLDQNIDYLLDFIAVAGEGVNVVALCQAVVPALAAVAILSKRSHESSVGSLTLIGGPIDPLANPTRVVQLLRAHELSWFEDNVLRLASPSSAAHGRLMYPGYKQLASLMVYLNRHVMQRGELFYKVFSDDGLDSIGHPFFTLFTSVMDLPGEYFLDNIKAVFHKRDICCHSLSWSGEIVDLSQITSIPLMTIEGEDDDIAAPGQTSAVHGLCPLIPETMRRHLLVPGCGHFSLFYGNKWRSQVLPELGEFLEGAGGG